MLYLNKFPNGIVCKTEMNHFFIKLKTKEFSIDPTYRQFDVHCDYVIYSRDDIPSREVQLENLLISNCKNLPDHEYCVQKEMIYSHISAAIFLNNEFNLFDNTVFPLDEELLNQHKINCYIKSTKYLSFYCEHKFSELFQKISNIEGFDNLKRLF